MFHTFLVSCADLFDQYLRLCHQPIICMINQYHDDKVNKNFETYLIL